VEESGSKELKLEVAAFRHVKEKKSGAYLWHIYNPRYRKPIDVSRPPKKFKAWCRKVVDADIYLLERDRKLASGGSTSKKGRSTGKKPDQMVARWLHIL